MDRILQPPKATADLLTGLNSAQHQAVTKTEGPILVLSGAGTGKTKVLTTRIAYLLAQQLAKPQEILAVTFTNKAAQEMQMRVKHLTADFTNNLPWIGTFHSIGVKLLRRYAKLVGLDNQFTILNTDDTLKIGKQILESENIDIKRWPARHLLHLIDEWKSRALFPQDLGLAEADKIADGAGKRLYKLYQERLTYLNYCDFGDLLLLPIKLFKQNPDVLLHYQRQFKYILVDEYQDTNVAQYLWLQYLTGAPTHNKNIFCVGDEDQSIYSWRGADIKNILGFQKDFPAATILKLETNYRSTPPILACATNLISHNLSRLGKNLHAADPKSVAPLVELHNAWDSGEEARAIGNKIKELQKQAVQLNEMAILVRASFQLREFEEVCNKMSIDYRVIGGLKFYERAEIRDIIAYLRLVMQQKDDLAFMRIINLPRRGLGEATLNIIHRFADKADISLFEAAQALVHSEELSKRAKTSLDKFLNQILAWQQLSLNLAPHELASRILDDSGYIAMWQATDTIEAKGKIENLVELVNSLSDYNSLVEFLEHIALIIEKDTNEIEKAQISLMTLHAAKGLEFNTVFLPGWEEGLFPHDKQNTEEKIEEERRLAYVGITRAKQRLYIWCANRRRINNHWQSSTPSRFLAELPKNQIRRYRKHLNYEQNLISTLNNNELMSAYPTPGWQRMQRQASATPNPTPKTKPQEKFTVGERAFHIKYGYGVILAQDNDKLIIDFEKAGQKKVMAAFVSKQPDY